MRSTEETLVSQSNREQMVLMNKKLSTKLVAHKRRHQKTSASASGCAGLVSVLNVWLPSWKQLRILLDLLPP